MRISVVLFCLGSLALFLMSAWLGVPSRIREQQNVSTLPDKTAIVRAQAEKNKAAHPIVEQTTLAAVPNTSSLLQQIQNGLNSDNPGDQAAVFTNQLLVLIHSDPWAVAEFAESAEAGSWHTELMRVLAQNWAASNLPEAEKWVSQIANPDERDTMLSCVCFQVAQADPGRAIKTLEQQGLDSERREIMLGNLAQQWASQDLSAAVAWANNYPPNDLRDKLFMNIASAQARSAPVEAANIAVEKISPGPAQQEAVMAILNQWAAQNPAEAAAWAQLFPSNEFSDRARKELARIAYQAEQSSSGTPAELHLQQ
jgi:hypothetical protein